MIDCSHADELDILFDNFDTLSYSSFYINSASIPGGNLLDSSEVLSSIETSIGNPASSYSIVHTHSVATDPNAGASGPKLTSLPSVFLQEAITYDPSERGAISSVSFSLDVNFPADLSSVSFDQLFFAIGNSTVTDTRNFTAITGRSGWQTITIAGLTSGDFPSIDLSGYDAHL